MQVIKSIDTINIGDPLTNASGLALLVRNPELTKSKELDQPIEVLTLQKQIAQKIASISYFIISQSVINNDTIDIQGNFLINDLKIASKLQLLYVNDSFLVKSVEIVDYPELSSAMQ
jgi:hypothetical protein